MDERTRSKSALSRPVARRTVHSPRPETGVVEAGSPSGSSPPAQAPEDLEPPAAVESTLAMEIPTSAMSIADPPTIDASAVAGGFGDEEDDGVVVEEERTDDLDAKVLKIALNTPISLADVRSVQQAQASLASEATHVGPRK